MNQRAEVEKREDYRFGVLASVLYNLNRGKSRALTPADFFPSLAEAEKPKTQEEMRAKILELNSYFEGMRNQEN